jgi:hypothetical protein
MAKNKKLRKVGCTKISCEFLEEILKIPSDLSIIKIWQDPEDEIFGTVKILLEGNSMPSYEGNCDFLMFHYSDLKE